MLDELSESEKEQNRQLQRRLNEHADTASDEEFAEQLYDDQAPTPAEFKEKHRISTTGGQLEPPNSK